MNQTLTIFALLALAYFSAGQTIIRRDPCFEFVCLNGGRCTAPWDAPFCECPPGYSRNKCQTSISGPKPDNCGGCPYGQVCVDSGIRCVRQPCPTFRCVPKDECGGCPPGKKCELLFPPCAPPMECELESISPCIRPRCDPLPVCVDDVPISRDPCKNTVCQNGGTCTSPLDFPVCECPPVFFGDRCEFSVDPCFNFGCLNGGTCNAPADAPFCECPVGFTGKKCETPTDDCGGCPKGQVCQPTNVVCKKAPCPSHTCVPVTLPAVCNLACKIGFRCVLKPRQCPAYTRSCNSKPVAQCVPIKLGSCPKIPLYKSKPGPCQRSNCVTDKDCNVNSFEKCCSNICGNLQCTVVPVLEK